ncbi:MAG: hypothetical protein ACI4AB_03965 [Acetatifactor sp.]
MKADKWNKMVVGGTAAILLFIAGVTAWIDPFLHYHRTLDKFEYPLKDERYQNDGILRNYSYNAIITGTSMAQNFKTSEFDALWGASSVKVCFSGASFKEVDENVRRALKYNDDIEYVVRSLDGNRLNYPADLDEYENYPTYLYDDKIFNNVQYLLNKEVVPKTLAVVNYTRAGELTPTWDEYGSWSRYKAFGKEEVFRTWSEYAEQEEAYLLQPEDYNQIRENIRKNVLQTALENEEVTFYLFIPPYSICYWDTLVRTKQMDAQLSAEQTAVEMLLQADNVHIYAFDDRVEIISNLDNYTDALHYGEWINSEILRWMNTGEGELTKDNYVEYFEKLRRIYSAYDFSELQE